MNQQEAAGLLSKVAALVAQFDRRCEKASQAVSELTHQVPAMLQRSADTQLRYVSVEATRLVREAIEQPLAAYEARLTKAGSNLQQASCMLAAQMKRMEVLHRQLIWKVAGVTIASLLLLMVAGSSLSKYYYEEIRRNQASEELMKAYSQADVALCGGRLCAKVAKQDKRYGDYRIVESR